MTDVAKHYGRSGDLAVGGGLAGGGDLANRIAALLGRTGAELDALTATELAPVDEFHIRGRPATLELIAEMGVDASARVLDIGSGVGGPARTLAETCGCAVEGVDLTPEFVEAARALSEWVGLADRTRFTIADATALPFDDGVFDAAMTIHVAMNIAARDRLYAEAKRVLKPGGVFALYDVMQGEGGAPHYPVPWAREPAISHLKTPDETAALLEGAGFAIEQRNDSSAAGLAFFEAMREQRERGAAPPVTIQVLFGADYQAIAQNMVRNLAERRIRAVTMICRA